MKKTTNIKAKCLISSALSTVMCLAFVSSSAFAANDISYDTASASETAYIANDDNDDYQKFSVTLSVDEFADLASEYGGSVSIGDEDVAEPQVHEWTTVTFFNSDEDVLAAKDTPLLPETIQLQNVRFSSNITSVDVYFASGKSVNPIYWCTITQNGQNTSQRNVFVGTQYRIYMRITPNAQISESNPATVRFYWTDKNSELI